MVHDHGPDEGAGRQCLERILPDGSLKGACLPPSESEILFRWPELHNVWSHDGAVGGKLIDNLPPEPEDHDEIISALVLRLDDLAFDEGLYTRQKTKERPIKENN